MSDAPEIPEKLLDVIYDAAVEPHLWPSALTAIADLTKSQCGAMFGQDPGAKLYFTYDGRSDPVCSRIYGERHMRNPWADVMQSQHVGRVVLSDEVVDVSVLRSSGFYDEVLHPQYLLHNAMIMLASKTGFQVALNTCRSARQGPFGEHERRLLGSLVPHLRRSIQLGFRLDAYQTLQRASFDVLDRLSTGVILLDRRARVVYANTAANAFGGIGGPLILRHSTVAVATSPETQRLGELIHAAVHEARPGTMSLRRPADGQLLMIIASPVRSRDIGRFADLHMPDTAALLFVIDPSRGNAIPAAWMMDAYGLTPAEARVALSVSSGATLPETAIRLGLSPNTVKTHLGRVFAKTGTGRQTELARLMASIGLLAENNAAAPNGARTKD